MPRMARRSQTQTDKKTMPTAAPALADRVQRRQLEKALFWSGHERLRCRPRRRTARTGPGQARRIGQQPGRVTASGATDSRFRSLTARPAAGYGRQPRTRALYQGADRDHPPIPQQGCPRRRTEGRRARPPAPAGAAGPSGTPPARRSRRPSQAPGPAAVSPGSHVSPLVVRPANSALLRISGTPLGGGDHESSPANTPGRRSVHLPAPADVTPLPVRFAGGGSAVRACGEPREPAALLALVR